MRDSFRARIIAVVVLVAIAPLGVLGFWLTRSAERSGEALLRLRLSEALEDTESEIGTGWVQRRSALLDLADTDEIRSVFAQVGGPRPTTPPRLQDSFERVAVITTRSDTVPVWSAAAPRDRTDPVRVSLAVHDYATGSEIGRVVADVRMNALLPRTVNVPGAAGVVLGAFDPETGRALFPLPFDPELILRPEFEWGGETWITMQSRLVEPPVLLAVAAPIAPFTGPFQAAGRRGALLLALVASAGVLLTLLLTHRLTRSLEALASAAAAVNSGDLECTVEETGPDEIARVARSFNTMTESLRRMLGELAERQAQAAAGEFAASLAHEVRNPLTAIRLDLQVVEEQLEEDSPMRPVQQRALEEIVRLDTTVGNALASARGRGLGTRVLDLRDPLRAALHAASATFAERNVPMATPALDREVRVRGEPGALEQLFLNLLLNAAQAVDAGGRVTVALEMEGTRARVTISDDGPGIPPEVKDRIFQPFFSTKPDGTGLGLAIARRIAEAHGGKLEIAGADGTGTRAVVTLPCGV